MKDERGAHAGGIKWVLAQARHAHGGAGKPPPLHDERCTVVGSSPCNRGESGRLKGAVKDIPMQQGMTGSKAHATEEQRDGRLEAQESRHPSMKDAWSSGQQAEAVEQEMRGSEVHVTDERMEAWESHRWPSMRSSSL